jgi:hypothetical protein
LSGGFTRGALAEGSRLGVLQSRQPTLTRRSRAQCPLVRPEVIAPLSFSFVPNHSREMCSFINVPPRAPTKPNMRKPGGSLYYSSTNRTMDLPAALACDIDVVVKVLPFIHVMTQRSPRVPPGVPAAGVEGVDHHGLSAQRSPGPARGPSFKWRRRRPPCAQRSELAKGPARRARCATVGASRKSERHLEPERSHHAHGLKVQSAYAPPQRK